jgi:hypothetical protein
MHYVLFLSLALQDAAPEAPEKLYDVEAGRKIPLVFLKGVSTKTASPGDPIYLQTTFPILAGGRVAIPPGAYVTGSVLESKRAGKVKGRAELRIRLDSIILPDGTSKNFRGNVSGVDSNTGEVVDGEGAIKGRGGKMDDAKKIATAAGVGAAVGGAAGALSTIGSNSGDNVGDLNSTIRRPMIGSALGLAGGAAGMFVASLFMRGPDAVLTKGTDVDMVLDIPLRFRESELPRYTQMTPVTPPLPERNESGLIKRAP